MNVKEPTFALSELFPSQGEWTQEAYLALPTNRLVELVQGVLELLPTASESHQRLVKRLFIPFDAYVREKSLGEVLFAPLSVKLREETFRMPDVIFMNHENVERRGERFWRGADLVMEVLNPNDPERDAVVKVSEYARSRIPEYWLADPRDASIKVYVLPEGAEVYELHRHFRGSERATPRSLSGFGLSVAELFRAT